MDDSLSEKTINHFVKGAMILWVNLYGDDGQIHLMLNNDSMLKIQAVNAETAMPELLSIGILGPSVPENPNEKSEYITSD